MVFLLKMKMSKAQIMWGKNHFPYVPFLLCESFFVLKLISPEKPYQHSTKKIRYLLTNYLIYWIIQGPEEPFEW